MVNFRLCRKFPIIINGTYYHNFSFLIFNFSFTYAPLGADEGSHYADFPET